MSDCVTVSNWIQRRMHEIENLSVAAWMPVLLLGLDILEGCDRSLETGFGFRRNCGVGHVYTNTGIDSFGKTTLLIGLSVVAKFSDAL